MSFEIVASMKRSGIGENNFDPRLLITPLRLLAASLVLQCLQEGKVHTIALDLIILNR